MSEPLVDKAGRASIRDTVVQSFIKDYKDGIINRDDLGKRILWLYAEDGLAMQGEKE